MRITKRKILIGMLALFLSVVAYFVLLKDNTKKYIRNETIQYITELGWVNWNHARNESTVDYYQRFMQANLTATDSFTFSYAQKNTFGIRHFFVHHYCRENWKVKAHLDTAEANAVFVSIFASVSEGFESMQGNFPMKLFADTRNSSFRDGDIKGNLISLVSVLYHFNVDTFRKQLHPLSVPEALRLYSSNKSEKVHWKDMSISDSAASPQLLFLKQELSMIQGQRQVKARLLNKRIERVFDF